MTELYSSLVCSLLLRHLLDHPVHGKKRRWRVCSFSDLPQDVYQQLCELGRIAYKGILHDQQVVFSDLPEDFETLGLMQCAPELYADEGAAVSYNFLHLTVQEYLAAFHLSQQPVEKQIEHFKEYKKARKYKPHNFHMVLRFLCGITQFKEYSNEQLNTFLIEDFGDDLASVIRYVTSNTLHWLFETHDSKVIAKVLGSSGIQFDEEFRTVTPFDCFVLGYCVSHSNCTWKIDIVLCNIGDEGVEMLVRGAVEEETHCTGGIYKIDLSRNSITSEGVKLLLKFPKQLINKLQTLSLRQNKLDSESCAVLAHLIPHVPHLKWLDLSFNRNIGQGGTVPLVMSLTAHHSLELLLERTGIGMEDFQALGGLLSSSTSLKELDISHNDLPPDGTCQLASALCTNDTLQELDLSCNQIGVKGATAFAEMLRTNHTLVGLSLVECNIDSDGACQLASALCTNDTLQKLDLGENPIEVKGATAFAEILLKNKSLKELNLHHGSIGEEGTQKLIDSLTHNTTVEKLVLPGKYESSITSSGTDHRVLFSRYVELV